MRKHGGDGLLGREEIFGSELWEPLIMMESEVLHYRQHLSMRAKERWGRIWTGPFLDNKLSFLILSTSPLSELLVDVLASTAHFFGLTTPWKELHKKELIDHLGGNLTEKENTGI